jgi:hypothetical protein
LGFFCPKHKRRRDFRRQTPGRATPPHVGSSLFPGARQGREIHIETAFGQIA